MTVTSKKYSVPMSGQRPTPELKEQTLEVGRHGIIRQDNFTRPSRGNLATRDAGNEDDVEGVETQVVWTAWWNRHMRIGSSTCCSYVYHFYWGERLWGQCGFRKRCFHYQRRFTLCHDLQSA